MVKEWMTTARSWACASAQIGSHAGSSRHMAGGQMGKALEQLYPFPEKELLAALNQHPAAREVVWLQEEPANMGALFFLMPRLRRLAKPRAVRSVMLSASPSPATGSGKGHEVQQKTLLAMAL